MLIKMIRNRTIAGKKERLWAQIIRNKKREGRKGEREGGKRERERGREDRKGVG